VVERGKCTFVEKALAMQASGAVALIVIDAAGDADAERVHIPMVCADFKAGEALLREVGRPEDASSASAAIVHMQSVQVVIQSGEGDANENDSISGLRFRDVLHEAPQHWILDGWMLDDATWGALREVQTQLCSI